MYFFLSTTLKRSESRLTEDFEFQDCVLVQMEHFNNRAEPGFGAALCSPLVDALHGKRRFRGGFS